MIYRLPSIKRIGNRLTHYRVAGEGPKVVLLHDSPRSSRLYDNIMTQLASQFQVYALDTPGYGNSSPIEKTDPTIADFAAALDETLTTLGLGSVPLYARHTSAKIALEYAARTSSPPRLLILDGLAIRSRQPDEEFIQTYMHHYPIDSNGTFLAFEWSRIRDVMRWFPWFDRRDQTRVRSDFPSLDWLEP